MPDFTLVFNNLADSSTLSASTTNGTLVASNMLTDRKSQIWRSTGTSATLTLTWASAVNVDTAVLAFTNLTPTATIRFRAYTNTGDTTAVADSGTILACGAGSSGVSGVNAYSGRPNGSTYGKAYTTTAPSIRKVTIDIVDTSNSSGYVQVGRLIVGKYVTATYGVSYGASTSLEDGTKSYRAESGELISDIGYNYKTLKFDLAVLQPADRNIIWNALATVRKVKPFFACVSSIASDPMESQMFEIYGKLSSNVSMTYSDYGLFKTAIEIEEI